MKCLKQFLKFNTQAFFKGKKLVVVGIRPTKNQETGVVIGTTLEVAIVEDRTEYAPNKDGIIQSNLYEKFNLKIDSVVDVPINSHVTLQNVDAIVWGDYGNMLSVKGKADSINIVK